MPAHLRFVGEGDPYDEVLDFWLALGISVEVSTLLAELDLLWVDGRLRARASCAGDEGVHDKVVTCLLGVMRFRPFSESRWIGSATPCATLVACECVGLADVVRALTDNPLAQNYYIQCYSKLDECARLLVGRAS